MNHLIKDTTREQRIQIIKQAIGISMSGQDVPTDKALELAKEYIDGIIELKDVQNKIIELYKRS